MGSIERLKDREEDWGEDREGEKREDKDRNLRFGKVGGDDEASESWDLKKSNEERESNNPLTEDLL